MSGFDGNLHLTEISVGGGSATFTSVTSTGTVLSLRPTRPAQIIRWGFIAATVVDDATYPLTLTGNLRPVIGSTSNQTVGSTNTVQSATNGYNAAGQPALYSDVAGGSLTLTASASQVAAGKGVYHTMNPQAPASGSYYPVPGSTQPADTQLVVYPGQEFAIVIGATAPNAGTGVFFVEYKPLPFQGAQYNTAGQSVTNSATALSPSNATSNLTQYFQ